MKESSIRRAAREGRAALGTGLKEFASRGVPWIIEASGFDYHDRPRTRRLRHETIADLAGWFPGHQRHRDRAHPQVLQLPDPRDPRSGHHGRAGLRRFDNADEARAIVREAKYPPIGNRGISGQGMHTGYRSHGAIYTATEYAPWANANIITCVSIESLEELAENVERSPPSRSIDMIAYGHSDLSARLGVHLQLEHPTFKAAVPGSRGGVWGAWEAGPRSSAETEAQIKGVAASAARC